MSIRPRLMMNARRRMVRILRYFGIGKLLGWLEDLLVCGWLVGCYVWLISQSPQECYPVPP